MTSTSISLQDKSIKYSQSYDIVCQLALLGSKGITIEVAFTISPALGHVGHVVPGVVVYLSDLSG